MGNFQLNEKQVLYVGPPELCNSYRWEKNSENLNPKIGVTCVDDINSAKNKGFEIQTCNNAPVCEGLVLVNHPFKNNCYMDVMLAEDELFKQKFDAIGLVVSHLGVKSFKATTKVEDLCKYELEANGDVKIKCVSFDVAYKKSEEEKLSSQYSREEHYIGKFDMKDYQEAKSIVKQYQLKELEYLLKQRNPQFSNKLCSQTISTELSKELNDITQCAFSLNILHGVFSLSSNLKTTLSICKKVKVEIELNF